MPGTAASCNPSFMNGPRRQLVRRQSPAVYHRAARLNAARDLRARMVRRWYQMEGQPSVRQDTRRCPSVAAHWQMTQLIVTRPGFHAQPLPQ